VNLEVRVGLVAWLVVTSACTGAIPPAPDRPAVRSRAFELGPMRIDGTYGSMAGPYAEQTFDFSDMDWIVGFRSEVTDASSGERMSDEFFCHSQMQLGNDTRLIVTAMGIPSIRFPEGFGVPLKRILAGMPEQWRGVHLFGMVLNNHHPGLRKDVKVRLTVEYQSFAEGAVSADLKKLYKQGLTMTYEPEPGETAGHPPGCGLVVEGRTEHWYVPPGRQVTRRRFSNIVSLDARVHHAVVHLHNYGRSMRLTDLTAGKVLWETNAIYEPDRVQIAQIPAYSSVDGFPVYASHEYEIEAVYDNTTDKPVDAMAMMYLFWHPPGNEDLTYPAGPPAVGESAPGS